MRLSSGIRVRSTDPPSAVFRGQVWPCTGARDASYFPRYSAEEGQHRVLLETKGGEIAQTPPLYEIPCNRFAWSPARIYGHKPTDTQQGRTRTNTFQMT